MSLVKQNLLRITLLTGAAILLYCCHSGSGEADAQPGYDIILVAGQSNTFSGNGFDPQKDSGDPRIKQLARADSVNMKIIPAEEPLQHHARLPFNIGFALPFAKLYVKKYLEKDREVLLVPCGQGNTGFFGNYWNPGDTLYKDAVQRTRYALGLDKKNKLVAILWHQGESDVTWPGYEPRLDSMITRMRKEISGDQSVPFFLGGLVPGWVKKDTNRFVMQVAIRNTVKRVSNTVFVSPYYPFVLQTSNTGIAEVHYDAAAQRELGVRYFNMFDSLCKAR